MEKKGEEIREETRRTDWEIKGTKWIVGNDVVAQRNVIVIVDDCPNSNYIEEYSSAVVGYDDLHDVRLVLEPLLQIRNRVKHCPIIIDIIACFIFTYISFICYMLFLTTGLTVNILHVSKNS